MKRILLLTVLLLLLLNAVAQAAGGPMIKVAVEENKLSVRLKAQNAYRVLDEAQQPLLHIKDQQSAFLNIKDGVLYLNNDKLPPTVWLVPEQGQLVEVNRRVYRGSFKVTKTDENTIRIVNRLPLEEYLSAVLPKALVGEKQDAAILKAQAVAMRSTAYLSLGTRAEYDVPATAPDGNIPVYLGKNAEGLRETKALTETFGEVLLYRGAVIEAPYHVSSGGYTESGRNYYGKKLEYLPSKKDFDGKSIYYRWKTEFTPEELDAAFERAGYNFGKVLALQISKFPESFPVKQSEIDRTDTGRITTVTVLGNQGWVKIQAADFVRTLGLSSRLFGVIIGTPIPKTIDATVTDGMGNDVELIKIAVNINEPDTYKMPGDPINSKRISRNKDDKIVFYGLGTGTGLGLSQYGAKAMLEQELQDYLKNKVKTLAQSPAAKAPPQAEQSKSEPSKTDKPTAAVEYGSKPDQKQKPPVKPVKADKPEAPEPSSKLGADYYKKILAYYFPGTKVSKQY